MENNTDKELEEKIKSIYLELNPNHNDNYVIINTDDVIAVVPANVINEHINQNY